jgi:hypothetical protein
MTAPRSSSSRGLGATSSSSRSSFGDRDYSSSGSRSASGGRTASATGSRGGPGGPPPGGGNPGGQPGGGGSGGHPGDGHPGDGHPGDGHPGGGHHGGGYYGGGHRGWYCPPTYYAASSWYWGGPWDWWWGWGSGWGWGWGGGGVYVINEGTPVANQYARIDTDVSPESAEVYLDGTLIGQADDFDGFPDYLYLETGKYRLEFRHPSYEAVVKELDVRAGQAVSLNDQMGLLAGVKKLQVVDPEDRGTPLGRVFGKPEAQGGQTEGGRTGRFDVQGGPDSGIDGVPVDIDLDDLDEDVPTPRPQAPRADAEAWRSTEQNGGDLAPAAQGRLRFEIEPDDAAVYVDDRYVGTAEELAGLSRGLRVQPGRHTVTVVRPGYETKTVDVESKPGAAIDVVIELER